MEYGWRCSSQAKNQNEVFKTALTRAHMRLHAFGARDYDGQTGQYDVTIHVEARKFKADGDGKETEVPVDDWIDIGAFTKPASGRKYGDTLYRQRMHITRRDSTFTFTVARMPATAGIDPFAY